MAEDVYSFLEGSTSFQDTFIEEDISLMTTNIAEELEEQDLNEIARILIRAFEEDKNSRAEWETTNQKWLELASQIVEPKNEPWQNASNVKYPLLTTAAIQFHARSMPSLINNNRPVLQGVVGRDPTGEKRKRANRVSKYMSYQVLTEMEDWIDELDRQLFILPIAGTVFKKTYYNPLKDRNVSELVLPQDLVINYYAKDFDAARKTHVIPMSCNKLKEHQRNGIYLDIEIAPPKSDAVLIKDNTVRDKIHGLSPNAPEEDIPHVILEMYEYLDLDEDGYKEPYIITIDYFSQKVLRIIANWSTRNYNLDAEGTVLSITPNGYFTNYIYIPSPESKIYGIGMGNLLGPLNEAINTTTNQLIDAGTLANLQGGFLGRGIRFKGGKLRFKPGLWQSIESSGDDIRKSIFPLPVKEPSLVLFQLLGLLIDSGERLSSVNNMMTGENPGQNQPYSTTVTVLEQGLKVYASIYSRIHRALGKEYKKLYDLNRLFLTEDKYLNVLDEDEFVQASILDFSDAEADIKVASDPNMITEAQKLIKAESLMQKMMAGMIPNGQEVIRRVLEAEGHEDIDILMTPPGPPQPDFKTQLEMAKFEWSKVTDKFNMQLDSIRIEFEALKDQAVAIEKLANAEAKEQGTQLEGYKAFADQLKSREDVLNQRIQSLVAMAQATEKMKQQQQAELSPTEEAPT